MTSTHKQSVVKKIDFADIYMDDAIIDGVQEVLQSGRYVKGPVLEKFEKEFAQQSDCEHAIGVANGTAALLLGMKALDLPAESEVFVPGHSYFATVSPALELGLTPRFVEIDPDRYTMDPEHLLDAVRQADNPGAVVVTHMHGQPAEMDPILDVAEEYDLKVVEDAAQAHLAEYRDQAVGSIGDVGCFSFYPTKNMTVAGDGGMIITNKEEIAQASRELRNHGRNKSGEHVRLGLNYRLDEASAVVGREQLAHLSDWNNQRRERADQYNARLADVDWIVTPPNPDDSKPVYHHYAIQVPDGTRTDFRNHLTENGIDTGVHYPKALHEHTAVEERTEDVSLPVAEDYCARTVSLPMHPRLSTAEIGYVVDTIKGFNR